jgi:hypothetical protein
MNAEEARNIASNFDPTRKWVSFAEHHILEHAKAGNFKTEIVLAYSNIKAGPESVKLVVNELRLNGFEVVDLSKELYYPYYPCIEVSWK